MASAAQKRATLKAYMAGEDATTAGATCGMDANAVKRAYLALDRQERLSISRELLLEQLRIIQLEIAITDERLLQALKAKNRSRGSADTAMKNLTSALWSLRVQQDALQKQLDAIEAAMSGAKKRRAKNSHRLREDQ